MPRIFLILFFILIANLSVFAGITRKQSEKNGLVVNKSVPKEKVLVDTFTSLKVRQFNARRIEEYRNSRDFKYDSVAPEPESLWSRFWSWFWRFFESIFSSSTAGTYFGYLVIASFVASMVFVFMKLSGMDFKVFTSKSKIVEVPYTESLDNIHEINFNDQIEQAVANSNYRLAIRIYYLRTLKFLSDTGQISWQPEKTNQTYVSEVVDFDIRNRFKVLTCQFEFVWYGEFFLNKDSFNELKEDFETFKRKSS